MAADFLTSILRRAVPTVPIASAKISQYRISYVGWDNQIRHLPEYYISCKGSVDFWREFKRRYPQWKRNALNIISATYGPLWLRDDEPTCPSFPSVEDLLRWLGDTIDPSGVTTNLLLLTSGPVC